MDAVIDCALRKLLANRKDLFNEIDQSYSRFEPDDEVNGYSEGKNSGAIFGRIVYIVNNNIIRRSPPLVLKVTPKVIPFPDFHMFACTNEIFFYTQVLPFFASLRDADHLFPRFYGSQLDINVNSLDAVIILENLQSTRYKHSEEKSFLSYTHLALMMRKIGEFHAYSYAARSINKKHFLALANSFTENFFPIVGKMHYLIPNCGLRGLKPLRGDTKYSPEVPELEKLMKTANELVSKILRKDTENPVHVLCHGDYLRSNVLFKYNEKEPIDLKFIDLASCKLASPAIDLATVLYFHADQKMRDEHWDDLIDEYYQALQSTFPQIEIPTKANILSEFKRNSLFAYYTTSYFLGRLIAMDNNLQTDFIPLEVQRQYSYSYSLYPEDVYLRHLDMVGGPLATCALGNILKDMIDRNFI